MGIQRRNIPHFKGLIMLYLDSKVQGRDSTFTIHHAHLKKAILLHKMTRVPSDLNTAVSNLVFYSVWFVPEEFFLSS